MDLWELMYVRKNLAAGSMTILNRHPDQRWIIDCAERLPKQQYFMHFTEKPVMMASGQHSIMKLEWLCMDKTIVKQFIFDVKATDPKNDVIRHACMDEAQAQNRSLINIHTLQIKGRHTRVLEKMKTGWLNLSRKLQNISPKDAMQIVETGLKEFEKTFVKETTVVDPKTGGPKPVVSDDARMLQEEIYDKLFDSIKRVMNVMDRYKGIHALRFSTNSEVIPRSDPSQDYAMHFETKKGEPGLYEVTQYGPLYFLLQKLHKLRGDKSYVFHNKTKKQFSNYRNFKRNIKKG
jgi:hypothetical protein